jgi:hypothetical protein
MELKAFCPETLWIAKSPLRTYGLEIGTRMTVCRLTGGDLWIHSPIAPDRDLCQQLNSLGTVRFVVAPNRHHHFFLGDFLGAYPEALLFGSPDLPSKRKDLAFEGVLGDIPDPRWSTDFDQVLMQGNLFHDEVAFFHSESRTLIVADLCMSVHPEQPLLTRLVGWIAGIYQNPSPPLDVKLAYWNKKATCASLENIRDWDFDRMILAHGHLIHSDAKQVFEQAYQFLLH